MKISQTILLATILTVSAHAQWKPPAPQEFHVETEDVVITVAEEVRDAARGFKGKVLIRSMLVRYLIATSDRRQNQVTALLLGASNEDAMAVDAVIYEGGITPESSGAQYLVVRFYAGGRLVAKKDVTLKNDPDNMRAKRIYAGAWELYQQKK